MQESNARKPRTDDIPWGKLVERARGKNIRRIKMKVGKYDWMDGLRITWVEKTKMRRESGKGESHPRVLLRDMIENGLVSAV